MTWPNLLPSSPCQAGVPTIASIDRTTGTAATPVVCAVGAGEGRARGGKSANTSALAGAILPSVAPSRNKLNACAAGVGVAVLVATGVSAATFRNCCVPASCSPSILFSPRAAGTSSSVAVGAGVYRASTRVVGARPTARLASASTGGACVMLSPLSRSDEGDLLGVASPAATTTDGTGAMTVFGVSATPSWTRPASSSTIDFAVSGLPVRALGLPAGVSVLPVACAGRCAPAA